MADPTPHPAPPKPPAAAAPTLPANPTVPPSLRILQYTGIPASVLTWRPRLPSRNWLIFFTLTGTLTGAWYYDRRECRRLQEAYKDRVRWMAEQKLGGPEDRPRRLRVYAAVWPESDEGGAKWFKKYVKPILHAAAHDYHIEIGHTHGALTRLLAQRIQSRRRQALGLEPLPPPSPIDPSVEDARDLAGGVALMGRHTLKEYLAGLAEGWSGALQASARDTDLPKRIDASLPAFPDDADTLPAVFVPSSEPALPALSPPTLAPLSGPPTFIPAHPPVLVIPYVQPLGFKQIPRMIGGFFNHRARVREGGDAALRLIFGTARPIEPPRENAEEDFPPLDEPLPAPEARAPQGGWADSELDAEDLIKSSFELVPSNIHQRRKDYYAALVPRLKTARELALGEREPSKEEVEKPPKTERELREEAVEREKRWRDELEGWGVARKGAGVRWKRWMDGLREYGEYPEELRVE